MYLVRLFNPLLLHPFSLGLLESQRLNCRPRELVSVISYSPFTTTKAREFGNQHSRR
jgi:hypothetical protein